MTPLDGVDVLLADLDGVVYAGPTAIPHRRGGLNRAAETLRVGYITNNASRTDASVADHLTELGLTVAAGRRRHLAAGGGAPARRARRPPAPRSSWSAATGSSSRSRRPDSSSPARPTTPPPPSCRASRPRSAGRSWPRQRSRCTPTAGGGGIPWVATNTDWTIPVARGIAPGNGTLVSAVHTAVGRLPLVAGKPEVRDLRGGRRALRRARTPLFIGDRLDTDILGANRAGIASVLVLTGIDKAKQAARRRRDIAADVHPRGPAPAARAVPGDRALSRGRQRRSTWPARRAPRAATTSRSWSRRRRDRPAARGLRGDLGIRPADLRAQRSGTTVPRPVIEGVLSLSARR